MKTTRKIQKLSRENRKVDNYRDTEMKKDTDTNKTIEINSQGVDRLFTTRWSRQRKKRDRREENEEKENDLETLQKKDRVDNYHDIETEKDTNTNKFQKGTNGVVDHLLPGNDRDGEEKKMKKKKMIQKFTREKRKSG